MSNAMPLRWHKGCLKNREENLEHKKKELERLQQEISRSKDEIFFYRTQIYYAEEEGKEGFDSSKYRVKLKKED